MLTLVRLIHTIERACTWKSMLNLSLLSEAWHTRQNIYIMPLYPRTKMLPKPLQLTTGDQGATSNVRV